MDSQKMLQAMFMEATIGVIVVDAEGKIVKVNPFAQKLFGYKSDEMIAQHIEMLLPNSFRKRHVQHRQNYHKNPVPRTMGATLDLYGLKKDGSRFPIKISLSHMDIDGERYAIAYASDDTETKKMLSEITESKELLDEAQKLAHVGSFEIDMETREVKMSDEMKRIYGMDVDSDTFDYGEGIDLVHPDDKGMVLEFHQRMVKEKTGFDFGYRIHPMTGGLRYVHGKRDVIIDKDGKVSKIFGMVQDITDLREVERINEDISRIMEESLNEIYIFHGETLKFIQVNKGARQNMKRTLEEMQALTPIDIKPLFEKEEFVKVIQPLKDGVEKKLLFETVHERKDKTTYPVEVHLQYSTLGKEPVFVAFISDISERKKYEARILKQSDELEIKVIERTKELRESETKLRVSLEKEKELSELKSRFVSMASHEFRTPLSSILSSANLIGRYEKEEQHDKRMRHVNRIESSVRNLTMILNDFLSLEKLESGKVRFNPVKLDIYDFAQQILDEVNLTVKGDQKVVHFHKGNNFIFTDEHLLKNILINLLSNGIKYSPNEKNVELHTDTKGGNFQARVKDYGIGIPESEKQHMFTRFFRANNVETIQGTGLGLTIVKRYLDLMNGKIWFESKEGEGTTFFIEIPCS